MIRKQRKVTVVTSHSTCNSFMYLDLSKSRKRQMFLLKGTTLFSVELSLQTPFFSSFLTQLNQTPLPVSLSLEDSELLSFYSSQSLAHLSCLADAIDVLFSSVQGNQPPRIFVARGKSLIVTAHKLVFIGDTLSRLLSSADLRAKVCRGKAHCKT